MNLSALTGRYGGRTAARKPAAGKADVNAALECVVKNVGHTRAEIVKLLGRKYGLTETRARLALKVLKERGDIECEEGLCQATVQGMLK